MNLMMMKRLVDGDDNFAGRVEAACWATGTEFNAQVLRAVAADADVQSGANLDEHLTIDSSGVSDEAIIAAVQAHASN